MIVQEHWGHDGFHGTDLDLQLRQRGVENIILAGMALDRCVAATARAGAELGYHVTLVRDATATLARRGAASGRPPFAHAVVTTGELAAALEHADLTVTLADGTCSSYRPLASGPMYAARSRAAWSASPAARSFSRA